MKKKVKDLTLEEIYKIITNHKKGSSCQYCPLYPLLGLPCNNYCDNSFTNKTLLQYLEKDLEKEIEVEDEI